MSDHIPDITEKVQPMTLDGLIEIFKAREEKLRYPHKGQEEWAMSSVWKEAADFIHDNREALEAGMRGGLRFKRDDDGHYYEVNLNDEPIWCDPDSGRSVVYYYDRAAVMNCVRERGMTAEFVDDVEPFDGIHKPQTPETGVNAYFGTWPGDETEEELLALLDDDEEVPE